MQELEGSVAGWTDDLASLFLLRDSLQGTVSTDDITVLQQRLQLLQCQWGEVCHQVGSSSIVTQKSHLSLNTVSYLIVFPAFFPLALLTQTTGEREAERMGGVQWEEQGAVWVAHTDGEQGLTKWGHQHWGDDGKAAQGEQALLTGRTFFFKKQTNGKTSMIVWLVSHTTESMGSPCLKLFGVFLPGVPGGDQCGSGKQATAAGHGGASGEGQPRE